VRRRHGIHYLLSSRKSLLIAVFVLAGAAFLSSYLFSTSKFGIGLDLKLGDTLLERLPEGVPHPAIAIIEVDDRTVAAYDGVWPLKRQHYALLLNGLREVDARVVAFDLSFIGASPDSLGDLMLVSTASYQGSTILAAHLTPAASNPPPLHLDTPASFSLPEEMNRYGTFPHALAVQAPYEQLRMVVAGIGHLTASVDADGVVRRMPLAVQVGRNLYPCLALAVACRYWDVLLQDLKLSDDGRVVIEKDGSALASIPVQEDGLLEISFRMRRVDFPVRHSLLHVLSAIKRKGQTGKHEPILEAFRDKAVVVGPAAPKSVLGDFYPIPGSPSAPGMYIHVNALNDMLQNTFFTPPARSTILLLALAIAVGLAGALVTLPVVPGTIVFLGALGGYVAASYVSLDRFGVRLPLLMVLSEIVLLHLFFFGSSLIKRTLQAREKERVQAALHRAVSKEIAEEMLSGDISAEGELREVTVLYADVRGFTALSETIPAQEVISLLNEYLSAMVPIITANDGVIDKFVGDEIFAVFGAPVEHRDGAFAAVKAALGMKERLTVLDGEWAAEGKPKIEIGIGINTGAVVAGTLGTKTRSNYTVIGEAVNAGSRLCTRAEPGQIIIGPTTYLRTKNRVKVNPLEPVTVKGVSFPLNIFEVTGLL
jgi:adenylate cyclase